MCMLFQLLLVGHVVDKTKVGSSYTFFIHTKLIDFGDSTTHQPQEKQAVKMKIN